MEKKIISAFKIPKAELYKQILPTPAALKTLSWKAKDGTIHQLTAEQYKRVENEWVTYTPGGPVVAPEGDSRPALVNDFSSMFAIPVEATPVVAAPSFFNVTPPSFFNVTVK